MKMRCDLSCPAECSGPCKYHPKSSELLEDKMPATLEQRKARMLSGMDDCVSCCSAYDWYDRNKEYLRELLQPSSQAPENEVDEAVKYFKDGSHCVYDEPYLKTLIKAAQQPRQEWQDPQSLYDELECDSLDAICECIGAPKEYNDGKEMMRSWFLRRLKKRLPEPPKDKP